MVVTGGRTISPESGGNYGVGTEILDLDDVDAGWRPGPPVPNGVSWANSLYFRDSLLLVGGSGQCVNCFEYPYW